jgi:hypothetical protein
MADAKARKAAIKKASSQVRSAGVSVRRSGAAGAFRSSRSGLTLSVRSGTVAKASKKSR